MNTCMNPLCFVAGVGLAAAGLQAQSVRIVVNVGDYPSAHDAACDEANVEWDDGRDADDVICTECFAAVELQRFLRKLSGGRSQDDFAIIDDDEPLPACRVILIGNPRTNRAIGSLPAVNRLDREYVDQGAQGYLIRSIEPAGGHGPGADETNARRMLIIGGPHRVGTLYGVYGFLDHLGVRWLSPDDCGEDLPETPFAWPESLDIKERPSFRTRGFHAWENRGNTAFYDWMARNRLNYWCVQTDDPAGLKKRGIRMNCGGHRLQQMFINPSDRYPYEHIRFNNDDALPADPYPVSEEYQGDANGDGVLSYKEAHPEWYYIKDGKRNFNVRKFNFCTSNEHACDELTGNIVRALIDGEWAEADSINFWTADWGKWCECDACRKLGTPTDRNLLLVHRMDQAIKQAIADGRLDREILVYFLAYADVLDPPSRPLPDGFDYDTCVATFFPISRCYVHAIADTKCTEFNKRYQNTFHGWFLDQDRHYRGQVFVGEYYNISGFKCLPIVFARTMSVDIPYYYRHGARHMHYMHCTTKHWGTKSLTNWQFARMLWNPGLDAEALITEYFDRRYGPAAKDARALYERLDTALSNARPLKYNLSRRLNDNQAELFPGKHMKFEPAVFADNDGPDLQEMVEAIDDCTAMLERIRRKPLPDRVQARLAQDAGPLQYASNTLHFYDVVVRAHRLVHADRKAEAATLLPEMKRLAQALERDTTSMAWSSSHGGSSNGLRSSYIVETYERLSNELRHVAD